ncbi:T9SS type A sorting domain-containing protein [Subsaximicrobium wynnwilliamsii]|uniref:T9SS type A sorting domain-containing protein n=1 Tax=Subsaximicrobium wynnwilliamsii TaxID=291179 RepID=A0A5C6ZPD5_9FLAO|nr:T9SS type A sorting domain-containing protein [Subsaximicrobium wynnwilliamsii]TXD85158.1 T9SS type A sorting domain-containing protein [Subsaximicrobium wynnwilliamsii]TXD91201.1 T9SS type A sorting domain-containing protein [Subsaximicrobium wynnwilliamsii]TXE04595.1 T9SS type A sorting domain-containing protein [Subsaximicrobium wynnwilliamsii]
MRKITFLIFAQLFSLCLFAQSTINITTSGGNYATEKWVSITTEVNGAGTQIFGQGDGTYGNGQGLINQDIELPAGTYYVNCYDRYADSWDGTLISVTAYGAVIGDNGGVTPDDGTDGDAASSWEDPELELETSFEIIVPEALCSIPDATFTVDNGCPTSDGTFSITVDISDIGTATSVSISDDQGTALQTGLAAGSYTFGDYADETDVVITVANDDEPTACFKTSGTLTFSGICPPANDECADAIELSVNTDFECGSFTAGTNAGATASSQEDNITGTPNTDVWYSFEATAEEHRITLTNVVNQGGGTSTSTDMGMGVYDSTGGCDALVLFDDSDPNTLNLEGLTVGTVYYVRVYGWFSSIQYNTFDICIGTPCQADAGTLTADAASVILSGATATISATEDTAPTVPSDYDVTYVLTLGTDLVIEEVAATPSFDVSTLGLYTIHTLVALTDPAFSADSNFLDLSVVAFGTTTAGEVLDIVGDNDICAALDVAGAPISVNDGSELDFYNVQYVEETGSDPSNGSSQSLTVEVGTPITVYAKGYEDGLTNPAGQAAGIECWIAINDENTDPATWDASVWQEATYLGDNGNDDEYSYETSGTPIGANYVAARWRLNNADFTYGAFNGAWDGTTNVNIELIIEPLANDDCAGAQSVMQETEIADAASATAIPGTIDGATDSGLAAEACSGFVGTANDDVWYSFEALTSEVNITYEIAWDGVAQLYSGTCGALTAIDCADSTFGSGPQEEIQATGLTVGEIYYTRIYQFFAGSTAGKTFDLKIWSPCTADAGTLTADATPVSLSGGTATISATPNADIVVPTDFDVTFVLTSGTDLVIEQAGAAPSFDVTAVGNYTIHTLVAETSDDTSPNYLDLSVIDFGTTTAADVLDLVSTNSLCASLDAAGAAIEVDDALSVDGQDNRAFTYFPNPVKDQLHLKAQSPIENVVIFNMLGQEVMNVSPRSMEVDVNTNTLESGAYFATVTIGNTSKTIKLIKD